MRLLNLLKRLNQFVISIDSYSYAKNQHHRPILCLENPGVPDQPHIKWTESNRCIYGSVNTCKKPPYTAAVLSSQLIHYFPLVWACLTIPTWIFTKFVDFIDVQKTLSLILFVRYCSFKNPVLWLVLRFFGLYMWFLQKFRRSLAVSYSIKSTNEWIIFLSTPLP